MGAKISVAFLLGAGFSQAAGYPSTGDLTEKVLSGAGVYRHTDSTYYLNSPSPATVDSYVKLVTQFLAEIRVLVDRYLARFDGSCGRACNYEDLSYIAGQIYGSESGEWDNPAVQPLIKELRPLTGQILDAERNRIESILDLAAESQNYIADIVWRSLVGAPSTIRHLTWFTRALDDKEIKVTVVGSLNHDIHLEQGLRTKRLEVCDGFEKVIRNVRYWDPRRLIQKGGHLPYLKLHGSVNWFRFRPDDATTWWEEKIGVPLDGDPWHTIDVKGRLQHPVENRPLLLVGTHNKISEYSSDVFADLHFAFRQRLRATKVLVVAGYGFGDKGINTTILEWLYSEPKRSIIYIHPDPANAQTRARGAIRHKWDTWLGNGKLRVIQVKVENLAWSALKRELRQANSP